MKPVRALEVDDLCHRGCHWLVAHVLTWVLLAVGVREGMGQEVDAEAQARVAMLIQNVLGSYPAGLCWTNGSINSSSGTSSNIETNFREASKLMPNRLDLRFGIASALVRQAIQTNSPFEARMTNALEEYQGIRALDTNGFQAAVLYAAYSRAVGETNASEAAIAQIMRIHPQKGRAYRERFRLIDEVLRVTPATNMPPGMPTNRNHAIVILGAGFETNGTMKPKLLDRLRQGRLLADAYPEAPIILTGGNQKGGITEAYAMGRWLMNEGISTNRLYLEDQARDTVGNAIFSCLILQKLDATHATLVTSASHVRRALADFEEASRQQGLSLEFSHFASKDDPPVNEARERVAIYKDVMRTSGIWEFPGIQR